MTLLFCRLTLVAVASVMAVASPSIARGQPAAAEAQADTQSAADDSPAGRRGGFARPLSEDELKEALTFAAEKMPNFHRLWTRLPEERQRRMPPRMQWGFRLMFDAKANGDDRLYEVLAQQMVLRDEFMTLRRDLVRSGGDESVRAQLMAKVAELVQAGVKQRELRIEKLEKMLAAEKAKLDDDRRNAEKLVEHQYRRLEEETSAFAGFVRRYRNQGAGDSPLRDAISPPASQPSKSSRD